DGCDHRMNGLHDYLPPGAGCPGPKGSPDFPPCVTELPTLAPYGADGWRKLARTRRRTGRSTVGGCPFVETRTPCSWLRGRVETRCRLARYSSVAGIGLNRVRCSLIPAGVMVVASTSMAVQVTLIDVAAMATVPAGTEPVFNINLIPIKKRTVSLVSAVTVFRCATAAAALLAASVPVAVRTTNLMFSGTPLKLVQ